jgi:hypothetical protein
MHTVDVSVWLSEQIGDHRFGPQSGKQGSNNNFVFTVYGRVKLKSSGGSFIVVPEGIEVCVYRPLEKAGGDKVATIFLPGEHVNIYAGGSWQRRQLPSGIRL